MGRLTSSVYAPTILRGNKCAKSHFGVTEEPLFSSIIALWSWPQVTSFNRQVFTHFFLRISHFHLNNLRYQRENIPHPLPPPPTRWCVLYILGPGEALNIYSSQALIIHKAIPLPHALLFLLCFLFLRTVSVFMCHFPSFFFLPV
jgi:hypothetical protein